MADSVEMQDIRGLDIDKIAKGFAEESYIFKSDCTVAKLTGDSIRWFSKTAGTLSATLPSKIANVSPLASPETIEQTWTRTTSYPRKFFVEGFISMEDITGAELDVLATTVRDLTLAITKEVDAHIWDVMSESQSAVNIQTVAAGAVWDVIADAQIIEDIMALKKMISDYNYNPEGASLYITPSDYRYLVSHIIATKGSAIPGFSSEKIKSGIVMQLLGINIKVSNNVTSDYALMIVPKRATTFRQQYSITARKVIEEGIGTRIRVWESGIAYNTDPKAIVLLTGLNT